MVLSFIEQMFQFKKLNTSSSLPLSYLSSLAVGFFPALPTRPLWRWKTFLPQPTTSPKRVRVGLTHDETTCRVSIYIEIPLNFDRWETIMQSLLAEQLVGQTIGNYRVERLLGRGRLN